MSCIAYKRDWSLRREEKEKKGGEEEEGWRKTEPRNRCRQRWVTKQSRVITRD